VHDVNKQILENLRIFQLFHQLIINYITKFIVNNYSKVHYIPTSMHIYFLQIITYYHI